MSVYAVKHGRTIGIFEDWDSCRESVVGFPYAEYKKFSSEEDALKWIDGNSVKKAAGSFITSLSNQFVSASETVTDYMASNLRVGEGVAYVDGSYDSSSGRFSYGCVLYSQGKKYALSGVDSHVDFSKLCNVAGELCGAFAAVEKAVELGLTALTLFVDYQGLISWTTGEWAVRNKYTALYKNFIRAVQSSIKLKIVWVKGHSGVEGNHEADKLARKAMKSDNLTDCMELLDTAEKFYSDYKMRVTS